MLLYSHFKSFPIFSLLACILAASCASYNFSFLSPQGLNFSSQSSTPFWSGTLSLSVSHYHSRNHPFSHFLFFFHPHSFSSTCSLLILLTQCRPVMHDNTANSISLTEPCVCVCVTVLSLLAIQFIHTIHLGPKPLPRPVSSAPCRLSHPFNNLLCCTVFTPKVVSTAVARYNFAARDMRELSLREGDVVKIYSKIGGDQGWWKGEANGRVRHELGKRRNKNSALARLTSVTKGEVWHYFLLHNCLN